MEKTIFQIIANSGEAKTKGLEALDAFQNGDLAKKDKLLKEAQEMVEKANKILFKLIHNEANGVKIPFSILLIHACDILMNSITQIELINRLTRNVNNVPTTKR